MTKPTFCFFAVKASAQSDKRLHCSHKKAWVLSYPLSAQHEGSDLSLRWAHIRFVGFVMRWLFCPFP